MRCICSGKLVSMARLIDDEDRYGAVLLVRLLHSSARRVMASLLAMRTFREKLHRQRSIYLV